MFGKEKEEEKLDEDLEEEEEDEGEVSSRGGKVVNVRNVKVHTHASFKSLIERYKKQNPVKFALKKKELEARLAALK